MKKVLFVSRDINKRHEGGFVVSLRNERILNMADYETERFTIPQVSKLTHFKNILLKKSYAETKKLRQKFIAKLQEDYDFIFFDGSQYGKFIKLAKKYNHKIITFYHNVELSYYKQKYNSTKKIQDKIFIKYIKNNESLTTLLSDKIITLNERDSKGLELIYGRKSDLILPTTFPKRNKIHIETENRIGLDNYLLFVGSNFFANIEGLKHFITNILPHIDLKLVVVGNIIESFKEYLHYPNIIFTGVVDNLDPYYNYATAVVAPIFSGSGLKTKTAEAFSYGKTIIGYPEAFEGINVNKYPEAGIIVKTEKEFINKLNDLDLSCKINANSIELFNNLLSDEKAKNKLFCLLKSIL